MILGVVGILLAVIIVGYLIGMYNSLIRLKHNIDKAWSNIDVLLKQRHDELTKLMQTVKGAMKFEKSVLTKITAARTAFLNAQSVPEKAKADNVMAGALKSIFAVAENYPEIKSNQNFMEFQKRVSGIEENISDRREFYNDSVNTYNIRIDQIPYVFMARLLSYQRKDLFKTAEGERKDVKISFE